MTDPPPPDHPPASTSPEPASVPDGPEQPVASSPNQSPFSRPAMDVIEKDADDQGVERR